MAIKQSDIDIPRLITVLGRAWDMDAEVVERIYRLGFCDGRVKAIEEMVKSSFDAVQLKAAVND